MASDRELYDRAADRHPTVLYVDQGALVAQHTWTAGCDGFHRPGPCPKGHDKRLELAGRLFGDDPGLILGRWDDVYFRADPAEEA